LNLQDATTKAWKGEKGLASPVILDGKVFFTTYTPVAEISVPKGDSCTTTFSDGISKLYMLDIFMGGAAYDSSEANLGSPPKPVDGNGEISDRSMDIGTGLVTDLVFYLPEKGPMKPALPPRKREKDMPSLENPLEPTFWMQQQ